MQAPDHTNDTDRSSFPYPDGWFVIATAAELKPGAIITKPFMGRDVVLYRTKTGVLRAVTPYCPHLGAHLGDGKIEGEDLVCPYHKFAFAPDGRCVRTGCGDKPPQARLEGRHVRDWNGFIAVWQGADKLTPDWELPEFDWTGYSAPIKGLRTHTGNLQNATENAFDFAHQHTLHGWESNTVSQPPTVNGYRIDLVTRLTAKGLPVTLDFKLYGLGLMRVEMSLERADVRATFLVVPTQIAPLKWTYRESMRLRIAWLSNWPILVQKIVYAVVSPALFYLWYLPQLQQDMDIWEKRNYTKYSKPSASDAPLITYRRWTTQFYPTPKNERPDSRPIENNLSNTTLDAQSDRDTHRIA
ncbi:Phenylpropionate dioxygenase, large terminal subunit [Pseudomonas chlororaphis]|uniref:Phenylpropionate dioxygenase, large terminal subunit n=1 Tax=Pseudomonas chlororaphis TaxID=587753 RepID=A0A3G7TMS6_9PSED|nr:Rieske 2Fe-2S domain-containing protein [Pseudomonas chlororaphis]AZE48403.1 Phenylpropionate dioxygenase, large terminal subunit [Pseudomonas chlororaphis]